jgi:hypothetical protein
MSTNAWFAVEGGMIPVLALSPDEYENITDEADETIRPHHVEIEDKTYMVLFVDAEAVGKPPMTPIEVREHLSLEWDARMLEYKPIWR